MLNKFKNRELALDHLARVLCSRENRKHRTDPYSVYEYLIKKMLTQSSDQIEISLSELADQFNEYKSRMGTIVKNLIKNRQLIRVQIGKPSNPSQPLGTSSIYRAPVLSCFFTSTHQLSLSEINKRLREQLQSDGRTIQTFKDSPVSRADTLKISRKVSHEIMAAIAGKRVGRFEWKYLSQDANFVLDRLGGLAFVSSRINQQNKDQYRVMFQSIIEQRGFARGQADKIE